MLRPPHYRPGFDWFAPLYDLGVWLASLLVGGEARIRRLTIEAMLGTDFKSVPSCSKGCRTLDVCCGTATLSLLMAERGALVYGLDIAKGMLKVAKEKAIKGDIRIGLVQADAVSIPFKERVFERVVVSMGLHEIPFDRMRDVFKEVRRVLKEGGRFVTLDYHRAEGIPGILQRLFFLFTEHSTAREWLRSDLQRELRVAGFKGFQ
ncbi:MAG: methyltransferase domain-containing protein, partial [Deltaproteobacteria bacterium]|nr:methyltransferase domain-containing protein [Deltaproteobacteria bacterium]